VETWTTNYLEQIRCSVRLVQEFDAKKIYCTRGSNYHVQVGGVSLEEVFATDVGAEEVSGVHVVPELFLDVDGTTFNFAHHIPASMSGWVYRSTPLAKEMMLAQLNRSDKWDFDVLVRSHVHYFWAVQSASKMAVLTPCWQLQTWYQYRKTASGSIPEIGAVRFLVDDGDYRLEKLLFKLQAAKPALVKA